MPKAFQKGSQPDKLNEYLKQGRSISDAEARDILGINRLAQRVADVHKHYMKELDSSPMMKVNQWTDQGHMYARYFYKGVGCTFEMYKKAVKYGE